MSEYEREGGFMGRWDGERCGVGWWVHWVFGGWVWAQQCYSMDQGARGRETEGCEGQRLVLAGVIKKRSNIT